MPARGGVETPPGAPSESKLTLAIRLPISLIKKTVAAQTQTPATFQGSNHLGCTQLPYVNGLKMGTNTQCADFNWHATVSPEGEPKIARAGKAIHVELPLRIDGQGGITGDLARALSLSSKNFEVHARPGVDLGVAMTDQWCPKISATPTGQWISSAKVEVIGRNCLGINLGPFGRREFCFGPADLDLTGPANQALAGQQEAIRQAAQNALPCETVRHAVGPHWTAMALPMPEAAGQRFYLNVVPQAAAMSAMVIEDDAVKLAFQVKAITQISNVAKNAEVLPLPTLGKMDAGSSNLSLRLQAIAPYEALTKVLAQEIKGKEFSQESQAGRVVLRVDDVTVYPSGAALAIGVKINANIPGSLFDTAGWVYLLGRPTVNAAGTNIKIEDLRYATVLNNSVWNAISALFNEQILQSLQSQASLDIRPLILEASKNVTQAVNSSAVPNLKLLAGTPTIAVDSILVGKDGFVVGTKLDMDFAMEVTSLK